MIIGRYLPIVALVTLAAAATLEAQTVTLSHQGRIRRYLLHVPPEPNGAVVLAFHGGGQRAEQMRQITRFDALADRHHFIVAYPDAVERSWADGRNDTSAEKQGVDDVAFAKSVVADIARAHPIDRARVFATGLSDGGGHRWPPPHSGENASEASQRENGVSSQNMSASEVIWTFFASHPRR